MARIVGGRVSSVRVFQLPPDGELLDVEGNQVWYGSPDGLGSVTSTGIGHCVTDASFSSSDEEDAPE
jgi:hypothetical protein